MKAAVEKLRSICFFSPVFLISVFVFVLPVAATGSPEIFSVVLPADNSMVEGDFVSVVVKVNSGSPDALRVSRNNSDVSNAPVHEGKDYYCRTIALAYGPDEITVSALKGGKIVETKKVTVFHRSDISKEYHINPPEFTNNPFHTGDKRNECGLCHRMELSEKDIKPANPGDSMCYQCHKRITSYSNVHGPAARWACLTCHDKSSSPVAFSTKQPDRDACYTCHQEEKEKWTRKKYFHGPTATGKCTLCHNPHASNNPFWLRKPTWDLCVTCHEDRASGAHVIVGFGSGTHPTKGRPDPLRYGKELTCASCHNPHASNSKALFRNDDDDPYNLCKACHKYK